MRTTSRIARALAALGLMAWVCWYGPPATATVAVAFDCPSGAATPQPSPTVNDCTPQNDQVLEGVWRITANATSNEFGNGIRRVDLYLTPRAVDDATCPGYDADPNASPVQSVQSTAQFGATNLPIDYVWDTVEGLFNRNACYTIRAQTVSNNGRTASATRTPVLVNNAPPKPKAPTVKLVTTHGINVEWSAPDPVIVPDLQSYTLLRARADSAKDKPGSYTAVLTTTNTSATDELTEPGAYWYKVVQTRRSVVTPTTGINSPQSDATSKPGVIDPPPTPSPTPSSVVVSTSPGAGGTSQPGSSPRNAGAPPLPNLPRVVIKPPPVPDAPFSAVLPYEPGADAGVSEEPGTDVGPIEEVAVGEDSSAVAAAREKLLPVAFGAFILSAAFALRHIAR